MGFRRINKLIPEAFEYIAKELENPTAPKPHYTSGKYESPIEDKFAWHITKYLKSNVEFYSQFPVKTICGGFRLDFVIGYNSKLIGFECDGQNFHDPYRDLWRDSMILGTNKIDSIFRLRGTDIHRYPIDLLYTIAKFHSPIFSSRGLISLSKLALDSTIHCPIDKTASCHLIEIREFDEEDTYQSLLMVDRRFQHTFKSHKYEWEDYFEFAKSIGGGDLDAVIEQYKLQDDNQSRNLW
jgi:hypothetical protein